jgi:hypothetical protein
VLCAQGVESYLLPRGDRLADLFASASQASAFIGCRLSTFCCSTGRRENLHLRPLLRRTRLRVLVLRPGYLPRHPHVPEPR